jgi:hypothetical protein
MVERLRAKPGGDAVPVTVGDMADVEVPRRPGEVASPPCDLVFCATNTFFGILDDDARRRCLERIATALAPEGALVLAAFVPPDDPERDEDVTVRTMTADRVVLSIARRDADAGRIEGHYVELTDAGTRLRPYVVRYAAPAELDGLAAAAGLALAERYADWYRAPFDPDGSTDHVSLYRRTS